MSASGEALGAWIVALSLVACGSTGSPSTVSPSSTTRGESAATATNISVAGSAGPNGPLTGATAACVDEGQAGWQVAIQGAIGGGKYSLKFNAPQGTTDLATKTTADIVVFLFQLPSGASWGADPRAGKGSGTLTVNGNAGGRVAVHLLPQAGSATAPVDITGVYGCSSNTSG